MSLIRQMPNLPPELRETLDKGRKYDALAAELALIAAELVEVRRLWSEATASQCRISGNYDVLVVKNERLEAKLRRVLALEGAVDGDTLDEIGRLLGSVAETKGVKSGT